MVDGIQLFSGSFVRTVTIMFNSVRLEKSEKKDLDAPLQVLKNEFWISRDQLRQIPDGDTVSCTHVRAFYLFIWHGIY